MFNQAAKNLIRIDTLRLSMKVEQNAMTQHRYSKRSDIVISNVVPPPRKRSCLSRQHDELRSTYAAAIVHVLPDEVRRILVLVSCRSNQVDHITRHRLRNRHHAHKLLEVEQ